MWAKSMVIAVLLILASLAVSCNDNGNSTTIVNQGFDCGLIRDDLVGTWTVNLGTAVPVLQNCTGLDPGLDSAALVTTDFPATYSPVDVFGSDGSTSFKFQADRFDARNDGSVDPEMTGSVQADSCLAIVRVWDTTDAMFFQCIGTLNLTNRIISGACDSAEIDSDVDGQLDTSCSLSTGVTFNAGIQ